MENLKVVKLDAYSIEFENGIELTSDHSQDCCEAHYLSFSDLTMEDFEGLEFNLTEDNFFNRIEGYGIELMPIKGFSVKVPGYGDNNGCYSSNLTLVVTDNKGFNKEYDITECQDY